MLRTAAVYSLPGVPHRHLVAAAGGSAGGGRRWVVHPGARARAGTRSHARAQARPECARRAHGPLGCVRHAGARRQARLLCAGGGAVRGRDERLLQRRRAVLRAGADEDAWCRRPRHLRFLPGACPRDRGPTSARRGPGGRGRSGVGGDSVSVAERPLRRGDPGRRALGARRPPFDPALPGTPRGGGVDSGSRRGLDLGRGCEERCHRVGGLGPEQLVRRADLGQLRLGCAVRRHPVLEEGANRPPDHGSEAWALLARDDARPVRGRPLARQPDSTLDGHRAREAPRTTRCFPHARSTAAPG